MTRLEGFYPFTGAWKSFRNGSLEGETTTGSVLLVTEDGTLSVVGDSNLRELLANAGYSVVVRSITATEDYSGIDAVVATYGVTHTEKYANPPVGMVLVDSWREYGMGNLGYAAAVNTAEVVDAASPLAGGVTGTFSPYLTPQYITWNTDLSASPNVVVTRPAEPTQAVVFGYEAGTTMPGRFATTRHVALGYHRDGLSAGLTADAEAQILAAVAWAIASSYVSPPAPAAPTNLTAMPGNEQVSLSWLRSAGADTYTVKRSGVTGGPYTVIQTGLTATSFTDTSLVNDVAYYYVVSATNATGESPDSSEVSATPAVPTMSAHFLYSDTQVLEQRNRMSGAGPFFSKGQGYYGPQTNAPGDGERAMGHATAFLADPTASRFAIPVPMVSGGPYAGQGGSSPSVNEALRPMRAAWCYMTLPSHPDNASWLHESREYLLYEARHANHDFANSNWYSVSYPGYYPSPIFAHGAWMVRHLKMYDFLGRDAFSSAELIELDRWFYSWANYILQHWERESNNGKMPGLQSGDPYTSSLSGLRDDPEQRAYNGGDLISNGGVMYTNRSMTCVDSGVIIANYLKYHGIQPDTSSGTQPSYGWWTVDFMLDFAKTAFQGWIIHSLHPDGWCFDFHRAQRYTSAKPTTGWTYAGNELHHVMAWARYAARRGDNSLFDFETTAGHINSAGVPTMGGFTHKSIRFAAWMFASYYVNGRVVTGGNGVTAPLVPDNGVRELASAAEVWEHYPDDDFLESAWTRVGNGFPGYPDHPNNNGAWYGYDVDQATYIGLIEYGGI